MKSVSRALCLSLALVVAVTAPNEARADQIGSMAFTVPKAPSVVRDMILNGTIDLFLATGLDDALQKAFPVGQTPPGEVIVRVFARGLIPIPTYIAPVSVIRTGDQTWTEALEENGFNDSIDSAENFNELENGFSDNNILTIEEPGVYNSGQDFGGLRTTNDELFCGPGTDYSCVY